MKKIVSVLTVGLMFGSVISIKAATLIDAWDFYNLPATTTTTATPSLISATLGSGSIVVSAFGLGSPQGTSPERTAFTGDAVDNAFLGSDTTTVVPTQMALSIANMSANGKSMIFSFSMTGFMDPILSFATRGTATGFDTHAWSWSTDDSVFTPFTSLSANRTATWAVETIDFSSVNALDNSSTVYLMLSFSGATSASGNNRLDNIQINATAVPEPSTLALAVFGGLSCLLGFRKR